jgi:hypothetical protein
MAPKKRKVNDSLKREIFSKTELENMTRPLERLLIRGFKDTSSKAYDTLKEVAHKLAGWLILIGRDVNSENLDSVPDKRHALLAYKFLGLVWFDQLPLIDNESFSLLVAARFPGFIRPEDILEAFSQTDSKLELECKELIFQEFLSEKKILAVSVNSFPKLAS